MRKGVRLQFYFPEGERHEHHLLHEWLLDAARKCGIKGGSAPVRQYIPELLDDVLAGHINPGRLFDFETDLDGIATGYAAMDERRAVKSLVRVAPKA